MFYAMIITKTFGNKASIAVCVYAENKILAMYKGLAQAAKEDNHNFKHVRPDQVNFNIIKKWK